MAEAQTVRHHPGPPSNDPRWALVERIAASRSLQSSARLQEFLFYVAGCALRDAPGEATEQYIGIAVFGRAAGYNSSEDSIVRTHARLLRQKLAAYFADEGRDEPMVLSIPKGHYLPVFSPAPGTGPGSGPQSEAPPAPSLVSRAPLPLPVSDRGEAFPALIAPPVAAEPPGEAPAIPSPGSGQEARGRARKISAAAAFLLPALVLAAAAGWFYARHAAARVPATSAGPALDLLWGPFYKDPPLVIFSNALFLGDSKHGLRYTTAEEQRSASPDSLVETYTGIGELNSVYAITRLFDAHGAGFLLKRNRLVTWDEARARDLIFIGSPAENSSLSVIELPSQLTMTAGEGWAGVVNRHPLAGEPALYSRPEHPLTRDYAIIALRPGVENGRRILIFSGLTTLGTQAAVEFACREETLEQITARARAKDGSLRPFEALLETAVGGGVALQTRLVTLRTE